MQLAEDNLASKCHCSIIDLSSAILEGFFTMIEEDVAILLHLFFLTGQIAHYHGQSFPHPLQQWQGSCITVMSALLSHTPLHMYRIWCVLMVLLSISLVIKPSHSQFYCDFLVIFNFAVQFCSAETGYSLFFNLLYILYFPKKTFMII